MVLDTAKDAPISQATDDLEYEGHSQPIYSLELRFHCTVPTFTRAVQMRFDRRARLTCTGSG